MRSAHVNQDYTGLSLLNDTESLCPSYTRAPEPGLLNQTQHVPGNLGASGREHMLSPTEGETRSVTCSCVLGDAASFSTLPSSPQQPLPFSRSQANDFISYILKKEQSKGTNFPPQGHPRHILHPLLLRLGAI